MTRWTLLAAAAAGAFGLVAVSGCAADTASDEPAAEAPEADVGETETDEAALTAMKYYDCRGSFSDDMLTRVEVGLSATRLQVTDLSKDAAIPDMGTLDRSYRPSPQYTGAIRFDGFGKLEDSFSGDVAHVELIVSKELKAKAAQGKLWIRTSGSGGDSTSYFCKSKPAKIAVDTALRSRLACSLKLVCTDNNPPGSSCLSDLFINQSSNTNASLKMTYLEHFGVNVQRRQEMVGTATDLDRTTKKFGAKWGASSLQLTYRAGVTYVGTFKLPDGRTTEAKCNDLAMFD